MPVFIAQAAQTGNAMPFDPKPAGVEIAFDPSGQPTHRNTYPLHGAATTEADIDAALARLTDELQRAAARAKQLLSAQKR